MRIGRLGRWCFGRPAVVLSVWICVAGGGVLAAGQVFAKLSGLNTAEGVESVEGYRMINDATPGGPPVVALVDHLDPQAPGVREAVTRAALDLSRLPGVSSVSNPYGTGQQLPTADAFPLVATLVKTDDPVRRNAATDAATDRMRRLAGELHDAGQSGARVRVGGAAGLDREATQALRTDLQRAELLSLPLTLGLLIVVFGGVFVATLPVTAAVVSVLSAMVVLLGFSMVIDLDDNVVTAVTLMGLGLSIDYGLLLVGRYREELAAGFPPDIAVGRAWESAGTTILFSALTIAAALSGLFVFDAPGLRALGAAGVSIALVAMLVSLTLVAALLRVGRRAVWLARHRAGRHRAARSTDRGVFAALSRLVQRRAVLVTVLTLGVLLAAGAPLRDATSRAPGVAKLPRSLESVQVADELGTRFGQPQAPGVVVAARCAPAVLQAWARHLVDSGAAARTGPATAGQGLAWIVIQADTSGDRQSAAAQALVQRIRADRPPGVRSWVTGEAAALVDLRESLRTDLPWAVATSVLLMVVLLFVMTGSLVIPVKAVLANVVSLGATFGLMKLVFQDGWLAGPLHTITVGGLDLYLVVIIFAFAFGLSVDYEVFLLGRITEYLHLGTLLAARSDRVAVRLKDVTDTAVRRGLQHTGRIITSAALLMLIVFGCFAAGRMGSVEELGLGLATAVLVDATVVRCLLVPATMTIMGQWNWWPSRPLKNLHVQIRSQESDRHPRRHRGVHRKGLGKTQRSVIG